MYIKPFAVEEWMNEWEVGARYNIAETCVDSVSLNELFALTGEDKAAFLENLAARRLTYGDIEGAPAFRQGICSLYKTVKPENIVTTHGAAGANHHVFCSLVSPDDRVISVLPTYQQLYSIPESLGAKVKILPLSRENGYLPDLDALRALAVPGTKMICINNPNNPTGALMSRDMLEEIVQIARGGRVHSLRRGIPPSLPDRRVERVHCGSLRKGHLREQHVEGLLSCRAAARLDRHARQGRAPRARLSP